MFDRGLTLRTSTVLGSSARADDYWKSVVTFNYFLVTTLRSILVPTLSYETFFFTWSSQNDNKTNMPILHELVISSSQRTIRYNILNIFYVSLFVVICKACLLITIPWFYASNKYIITFRTCNAYVFITCISCFFIRVYMSPQIMNIMY